MEAVLISLGILLGIGILYVLWKMSVIMLRGFVEFMIYYLPSIALVALGIFISTKVVAVGVILILSGVLINFIPQYKSLRDRILDSIIQKLPRDL